MPCPWETLKQAPLEFCERSLCAWIKEPGNFWSNLAYIVVGIVLYRRSRKEENPQLIWIGITAILTGIGSSFFHMSGTYLGGCTDYLGMFLGTGLLTGYNVRRWLRCSFPAMYLVFAITAAALMGLTYAFPEENRLIYGLGMPCCLIELRLFFRDHKVTDYRAYVMGWALVTAATVFWWLDLSRTLCHPDNHVLSGHGMWHILTAIAFLPLYKFYSQFSVLREKV
jgi:hypothetical protein